MLQIGGPPDVESLTADQRARRQRIVRVALRTLASSDYDRVKVSEVARESGVALGTLYRYFASKEHLFAAVFVEWQGALKSKLEKSAPEEGTEADRLRGFFYRVIRAFQLQPQFFGVMMMLQATTDPYASEVYQASRSLFERTVEAVFDAPLDADRTAIFATLNAVLWASLTGWTMQRLTIEDVRRQVDETLRLIYGYCPEH